MQNDPSEKNKNSKFNFFIMSFQEHRKIVVNYQQ